MAYLAASATQVAKCLRHASNGLKTALGKICGAIGSAYACPQFMEHALRLRAAGTLRLRAAGRANKFWRNKF